MILQSAVSDLSPDAFQDVVGKVFGPATLGKLSFGSPVLAKSWRLVEDSDDAASPQKKSKVTKKPKSKASKLKAKNALK